MRFSLLTLFLLTTLVAGTLAVCRQDGALGVVLVAPTALVVLVGVWLVASSRKRMALALSGLYVACWLATAKWGFAAVEEHFATERVPRWLGKPGETFAVVKTWSTNPEAPRNREIWYYLENVSYPCPLVVSVDYQISTLSSVERGRVYALWLFGYRRILGHHVSLMACG